MTIASLKKALDRDPIYPATSNTIVCISRKQAENIIGQWEHAKRCSEATTKALAKLTRENAEAATLAFGNRLDAKCPQPGDLIVECSCPCCGASLEVMHGDDEPGDIGVLGVARLGVARD